MHRGAKGFGHIPANAQQVGKTAKGSRPSNPFAHGFAGFPHDKKLANPHKVDIGPTIHSTVQKSQLRIYSDSIGLGSAADPLSLGYMNRISAAFPQFTDVVNASENGRGLWRMCQQIQTGSWNSGPDNTAFIIVNGGLNDISRAGQDYFEFYKTLNKIRNCMFSMLLKPLQGAVTASGNASVTRSPGTFNSYFANTVGGLFVQSTGLPGADRASFTTSVGGKWTWTSGTCRHLYIQFIGACGGFPQAYQFGIASITIDGVLMGTYNGNFQYDGITDGVYDNGRGVVCVAFWDLPNTTHTVVVEHLSGTSTAIDFFSTITDNMRICPAFLVMEPPYITRQGYYGAPPSGIRGDRQSSNVAWQIMKDLVLFFRARGYNYGLGYSNKFYSLANCSSDGVHPTTKGHGQLLNAVLNAVKTYNQFQQGL